MAILTNQEAYKFMNEDVNRLEAFRNANPQFKLDNSNIPSTTQEVEYYENLYDNLDCALYEFHEKDFHFKRTDRYSFQDIFNDNWIPFSNEYASRIRDVVNQEVSKMMSCQDPSLGHALYQCPDCHEFICVPFTCKSRFCNTCAMKYQLDRALSISSKLLKCPHRHLVFTIPKELRTYFLEHRSLLDSLFKAVEDSILFYFRNRAKSKKLISGIILTLHTFGRDLKWNPHVHCLVTEGASSNIPNCSSSDIWINFTYFDYKFFRKSFRKVLLDFLKSELSSLLSDSDFRKFKQLVNSFYKNYKDGFYVRAKPSKYKSNSSTDGAVKYLIRYFNRPAMATSRILHYDGSFVVFYYQRHEDNMFVVEKVPVFEFIKRLIIHIPDKNFKMLRYAGIYSSHKCVHFDKLFKKISEISLKVKKQLANWRTRIELYFKYDPLKCPFCFKSTMQFLSVSIAKPPP